MAIDPIKLQIVQSCLEAVSKEFRPAKPRRLFDLPDTDVRFEVDFDRAFMEAISEDRLKYYVEVILIPTIRANPDKKFYVTNDGIEIISQASDQPSPN